jgi:gamma-glutamyltranspeptidase
VPVEHLLSEAWRASAHGAMPMSMAPCALARQASESRCSTGTRFRTGSAKSASVLMMLNVLTHHDVARLSELDRVHLFAEACKQAYHPTS